MVLWWPTRPSITNTPKRCPFHYMGKKVGSQETLGVAGKLGLGVQNEVVKRLREFCQENALVIANTLFQKHKRWLHTWTSPDGQYWNQTDYILCSQRWRSSLESAETRPGADCGSDHELLIAKFRLKLKKVRKTTGPFRYDLNQILYNYIVDVTNGFKGLDLIECLKNYGQKFVTLFRRQWLRRSPRKRNWKGKVVVWGSLTNHWEKKRSERKRRKRYTHQNAEFQRIARRDKKAFLSDQCKEIEEKIEWKRL